MPFHYSSIVCIGIPNKKRMTVHIDVEYKKSTTLDMKNAIEQTYNIPIKYQRLICAGKIMSDEDNLKKLNIFNETCIHLILIVPKKDMQQ
jgi:hypothetical protein